MTTHQRVLYWQVIHRDFSADDAVISRVVRPVMAENCPSGTWHYLRYFDERGPHVRVRVFPESASQEKTLLETITTGLDDALRRTINSLDASDHRQTQVFSQTHLQLPSTRDAGVHITMYEPEIQKYGSDRALKAAERIWNLSTQEAIRHVDPEWSPTGRLARAAADAYLAADHLFDQDFEAIRSFWTVYARYWSGGDQERLGSLSEEPVLHNLLADLEGEASAESTASSSWPVQLAQMCQSDTKMLNHQVHLHNNRLGVGPADEAALAVLILLLHRARAVQGGSRG